MINDFEKVKAQLIELAPIVNAFNSESVQLKVVELLMSNAFAEPAEAPVSEGTRSSPQARRRIRTTQSSAQSPSTSSAAALPADTTSIETFFGGFSQEKPAENVLAICAWLYSQQGVFTATPEDIEAVGSRVGLTTPRRIDMTLNVAKREGKGLFSKAGGAYSPTVHGELFFKQTYGVKKGIAKV